VTVSRAEMIDAAITASVDQNWKKTALIIARVLKSIGEQWSDGLEGDILERVVHLQGIGILEINGDISHPRTSEIRIITPR
jgi:hypothetical protein